MPLRTQRGVRKEEGLGAVRQLAGIGQ